MRERHAAAHLNGMSNQATILRTTPAERYAQQGIDAAQRMFVEITATTATPEDAVTQVTAAVSRVQDGPAPAEFKTAFLDTMDALLVSGATR